MVIAKLKMGWASLKMGCAIAAMVAAVGEAQKDVDALEFLLVHHSREAVAGLDCIALMTSMSAQVATVDVVPIVLLWSAEMQTELRVPTCLAHTLAIAQHHAGAVEGQPAVEMFASMSTSVACARPIHARASVTTMLVVFIAAVETGLCYHLATSVTRFRSTMSTNQPTRQTFHGGRDDSVWMRTCFSPRYLCWAAFYFW